MPLNSLLDSGQAIQPPPDVQRTTFGLDVLSRYVCSTWDEAASSGGFDAVVMGAGMFGFSYWPVPLICEPFGPLLPFSLSRLA